MDCSFVADFTFGLAARLCVARVAKRLCSFNTTGACSDGSPAAVSLTPTTMLRDLFGSANDQVRTHLRAISPHVAPGTLKVACRLGVLCVEVLATRSNSRRYCTNLARLSSSGSSGSPSERSGPVCGPIHRYSSSRRAPSRTSK